MHAGVAEERMGRFGDVPLQAATTQYIGKESNLIEEVGIGLWHRLEEVATAYGQALDPWRHFVVPVFRGSWPFS